jgi:hypothetical protein
MIAPADEIRKVLNIRVAKLVDPFSGRSPL